ncbi:IucA/IucC family siderophore biosynthesis protein [Paenibacillus sp. GSMTC-2017]|uniref:IucA/IucC family protein n=1 Tax=Paenibacillus sp. GSMTC-2017 TaxID=2794350 RepID=UPI0018D650B2|nr:IucA/IucC family protein [Paenibacillus sp. GSMTC-2017]MBH5319901.1 IucA/IucC family siderophore biosynthesis protein [Paenibacillus sp. GSMTC-2017]
MTDPRRIAERATVTSFLNCYLRETGRGEWRDVSTLNSFLVCKADAILVLHLQTQKLKIFAAAEYKSPTGRHQFQLPVFSQVGDSIPVPIHYTTFLALLVEELTEGHGEANTSELHIRVIQSCLLLETFIRMRQHAPKELYDLDQTFIQSEQSLLFGHTFHPTPKSRQGFPEWRQEAYSPESKGSFQLHYFAVNRSLVQEKSAWSETASDLVRAELLQGIDLTNDSAKEIAKYVINKSSTHTLIPVHPVQAEGLLHESQVKAWQQEGSMVYLGAMGREYSPTSSIRSVYHSDASYMYKFSLRVKITNSMRLNKRGELDTALEAARLMAVIEPKLKENYPHFTIIPDGAYLTVGESTQEESGFELLIRQNPFVGEEGRRVFVMAAFTQESIHGEDGLLASLIKEIEVQEDRAIKGICLDWFKQYLSLSLEPMMWLYRNYGIALEAHLQNCMVKLDERGYPERFYYRDSQGYYYARSMADTLENMLPGIITSENVYDDAIVEERFGYYLIVNHMLGLIQSFGIAGLIDERVLLLELRGALESMLPESERRCSFFPNWLTRNTFRCKANLLTRLYDMDELECELEQAIYVEMENPLYGGLPAMDVVRRARLVTSRWRREREVERSVKA